jgi:hypothetical protein
MDRRPPMAAVRPAVLVAGLYGVAALLVIWARWPWLPGRWLAVHLFTLGVLSNLVLVLTEHFAGTVQHAAAGDHRTSRLVIHNAGTLAVVAGLSAGAPLAVAVGATLVTAGVTWLYADLRGLRRASLGGRFAFVVRGYERACGAFIHGAVLGLLVGAGIVTGRWAGAVRLAHMHVNVLGWGGLTLLATVVFFGPTMLRRRIAPGAEQTARTALRWASTGLSVATIALILTGVGPPYEMPVRQIEAAGLLVYATAATGIWRSIVPGARPAPGSVEHWLLPATGAWFVAGVWTDVVLVATGTWRYLDALGVALLLGVLLQAVVGALVYLGPMLRGATAAQRADLRTRLQRLPRTKAVLLNAGIVLVLLAALHIDGGVVTPAGAGWTLVAVAVVASLAPLLWRPRERSTGTAHG